MDFIFDNCSLQKGGSMRKMTLISMGVLFILSVYGTAISADFYVIPVQKKDPDLMPENIRSGVNIFGVEGNLNVVGCTDVEPLCSTNPDGSCTFDYEKCCLRSSASCDRLVAECPSINPLACTWIGYCDGQLSTCHNVGRVLQR